MQIRSLVILCCLPILAACDSPSVHHESLKTSPVMEFRSENIMTMYGYENTSQISVNVLGFHEPNLSDKYGMVRLIVSASRTSDYTITSDFTREEAALVETGLANLLKVREKWLASMSKDKLVAAQYTVNGITFSIMNDQFQGDTYRQDKFRFIVTANGITAICFTDADKLLALKESLAKAGAKIGNLSALPRT